MLIAFRYGDSRLIARLICWWQRSDVSHCEVVLDHQAGVYVCVSASWLDGGVRSKTMELPPERWRIYDVAGGGPLTPFEWTCWHAGAGYDWLALVGLMLRPASRGQRRRWICSEAALDMLGVPQPWRYDVASTEAICRRFGERVQ